MGQASISPSTSLESREIEASTSRNSSSGVLLSGPAPAVAERSLGTIDSHDHDITSSFQTDASNDDTITTSNDPYSLLASKWEDENINKRSILLPRKVRKVKKYYNRQNALIDAYLGSNDEEAAEVEDTLQNGWKVKLAVNGSFSVNCFLFIIQMYAAVSTGSLSLFGTAADAFVSLPYRRLIRLNTS
jgi:hypothetical protein